MLREPSSGSSMFWEYSPSLANLASDWLKAESSPVNEEEIKIKMYYGLARYFARFGGIFVVVVDLWEAQPCLWDPE